MLQVTRNLPRALPGSTGSSTGSGGATPAVAATQQSTYAVPPGVLCYSQGQLATPTGTADVAGSGDSSVEVRRVCVPYEAQVLADVTYEEPTTTMDGDAASVLLGTASGAQLLGGFTVQMTDHVVWVEHAVSEECVRTRPVAVCIHDLAHSLASSSSGGGNSSENQSMMIALAVVAPCAAIALAIAAVFACLYMRQRRARKAAAVAALVATDFSPGDAGRGAYDSSNRSGDGAAGGRRSGGKAEAEDEPQDDVESGLGGDTASSSGSDRPTSGPAKGDGASKDVLFNGFEDATGDCTPTWRAAPVVTALDRCSIASAANGVQAPCAAADAAAGQPAPVCEDCGGPLAPSAAAGRPNAGTSTVVSPTLVALHSEIEPAPTSGVIGVTGASDCGILTATCRCSTATESMASRTTSVQHHSLQHQLLLGRHSTAGGGPPPDNDVPGSSSAAGAGAGAGVGKFNRAPLPGGAVVVTLRPDQPRLAAALQALQQAQFVATATAVLAAAEPVGAAATQCAAGEAEAAPHTAADNSISLMSMVRGISQAGQHASQGAVPAPAARAAASAAAAAEHQEADADTRAASSGADEAGATSSWCQQQLSGLQPCKRDEQLQVLSLQDLGTSPGAQAPVVPACAGRSVLKTYADDNNALMGRQHCIMQTPCRINAANKRAQHTSTDAVEAPAAATAQDTNAKNALGSMSILRSREDEAVDEDATAAGARASEATSLSNTAGRALTSTQPAEATAAAPVACAPGAGISAAATENASYAQEATSTAQAQAAADVAGTHAPPSGAVQQQQPPQADAPAPDASAPATPSPGSRQAAQLEADEAAQAAADASGARDGAVQRAGSKMDLVLAELEEMKRSHAMEVKDVQLRLVELLGEGAFGVVYKGQWRGLDVAVKTVIFNSLGTTRRAALAEAALSAAVCHSNVVATYLVDVQPLFTPEAAAAAVAAAAADDGPLGASGSVALDYRLYIVQEFCDAGPLRQLILSGRLHNPLPPEAAAAAAALAAAASSGAGPSSGAENAAGGAAAASAQRTVESVHGAVRLVPVYEIALGIARALGHLHAKGIVHSDLSAANVLLKHDPTAVSGLSAKIADFGLSVMIPKHLTHLSGRRCGSPFYIAPEVYQRGHASPAADIFAFGVLLWELVMGTSAGVVDEATGQFQYSKLFPLLPGPRTCPPPLRQLVHACLQRLPAKRPSAAQVALLLERLLTAELRKASGGGAAASSAGGTMLPANAAGAAGAPEAGAPAGAIIAKGGGAPGGAALMAAPAVP
ncbi:hypothetical protein HYH02_007683 [Chlamydomonas schloesseri]|uniref:Protein kinase domain-containing protein n=1 Tax=Chlamydomonas schloesseri TaxID=2026947 RepID=A0A836B4V4_9CHLO|nr:hypothetical protein HYH02_007683 [Chlamydomonas schloesseri]|eukprot:KAG2447354.1 hypothetical protein HYH02_007683 [Chlamydomonas schloesseri]